MQDEIVVSTRVDRELTKQIITPGDFNIVPYEDSRCTVVLSNVQCTDAAGDCDIGLESRVFSKNFDGIVLIGDSDCYIDRDFELILQQMCCGEICIGRLLYKNKFLRTTKHIICQIELKEVTEEQVVSDWSWARLLEAAGHHKERGVALVKEKRILDAFRRFSKAFKFLVAIEPVDPEVISNESVKEIMELKVKLYNNLAHCQLQFNEHEAALDLCNRAIKIDPDNLKALYRRCISYQGLNMNEEAWIDIQQVVTLDPNDKTARNKAVELRATIEKINNDYASVIKKMFG